MRQFLPKLLFPAIAVLCLALFTPQTADAVVVYDESVNGDAPNGANTPGAGFNLGTLGDGPNTVRGSLPDFDSDIFDFTIAAGKQLSSVILTNWVTSFTGTFFSMDIHDGTTLEFGSPGNAANIGLDILPIVSSTAPLGAGSYTWRLLTGSAPITAYELDFVVSDAPAVSEPGALIILSVGLLGIGLTRRRRLQ